MQFKLEGQVIARNPQWEMDHRRLLHRIDHDGRTIEVDGVRYPLSDAHLPTVDPADPYELSAEERRCMDRLRRVVPGQPEALGAHAVPREPRARCTWSATAA